MIKSSILSVPVVAALILTGCNSEKRDSHSEKPASSNESEVANVVETTAGDEKCVAVGEYFAVSAGLNQLEFSDAEINSIVDGFKKGISGDASMEDMQTNMAVVRDFLQKKHMEKSAADSKVNKEAAAAYVEELKKNPAVKFTESGLGYEIKSEGEGDKPTLSDSVSVNYRGTLIDGTEFDASMDEANPVTFPLGGVIPGFSEGLQLVAKGGEIRLYIPSELGYGDNPRPGSPIKAGAMLVFDVTIRDIQKPTTEKPKLPQDLPPPPPPADKE